MKLRGLKATKPGIDASSRDIRDFVIHLQANMLKGTISFLSEVTVLAAGGINNIDVVHGLGYKPQFRVFMHEPDDNRYWQIPCLAQVGGGSPWTLYGGVEHLDNDTLRLRIGAGVSPPPSDKTVEYKCNIYIDPRKEAWYESASISPSPSVETYKGTEGEAIMKVSRIGYDVHTAESKDLVYSSKYFTPKIYRVMYFSGSGDAYHGLSYPPSFDFMTELSTDKWQIGNSGYWSSFNSPVSVDRKKVYVTEKCYVILYIDPLNE